MSFNNTYKDKVVLITGHTGFKGSWLTLWLLFLGAKVIGLSKDIPSEPSNFLASNIEEKIVHNLFDINDREALKNLIVKHKPDFIFHLAAQALVRKSYENPIETFETNAFGTINLLEVLRWVNHQITVVLITSDKAYDNVEWVWGYKETDRLGSKDPYSASKGMAELAIRSYIASYFNEEKNNIHIGVARAGNVIGGGDWAEDRIVPDCVKAWAENKEVMIRNPESTRPWQLVLEPLSGYLNLGQCLFASYKEKHGEAYNFGPTDSQNNTVRSLIHEMSKYWNSVEWNSPKKKNNDYYEAGLLKLNCDKALADLQWRPTLNFNETVKFTAEWYKNYYSIKEISMYDFSLNQIKMYIDLAHLRELPWAQ